MMPAWPKYAAGSRVRVLRGTCAGWVGQVQTFRYTRDAIEYSLIFPGGPGAEAAAGWFLQDDLVAEDTAC